MKVSYLKNGKYKTVEHDIPAKNKEIECSLLMREAVKEYNSILYDLGREDLTIGYCGKHKHWNLRDLVAEIDYQLSTYRELCHMNYERLYSSDKGERLQTVREIKRLKNFISKYEKQASSLVCSEYHCSRFDN